MVPAELGICALEGGITVGLRLLDPVGSIRISDLDHTRMKMNCIDSRWEREMFAYPFLWAFLFKVC